jgi:hypothetical protein
VKWERSNVKGETAKVKRVTGKVKWDTNRLGTGIKKASEEIRSSKVSGIGGCNF